ncbi:MAG: HAMP domain-containing sensor histidine kinase [Ferruginibacter sp.]
MNKTIFTLMNRQRWLNISMCVTLLIIMAFQAYWLSDNYNREKKALQIKTSIAFQQTLQQLQATKIKLPEGFMKYANHNEEDRIMLDENTTFDETGLRKRQMITLINTVGTKLRDSVKKDNPIRSTFVISLGKGMHENLHDSALIKFKDDDSNKQIFQVFLKVDSLQNTLTIPEITKAFSTTLKKQKLDIPFSIIKKDGIVAEEDSDPSHVSIGFVHPVTYILSLHDTAFYLIKKLTLPILFSFFLLGITIFSFVLMYRNLIRQQKLAETKNELISNITHELKTPIATVGVAIEALKNFNALDDAKKTKEYLDISSNELQRLGLLVDKVLRLSMFEKKEIELSKEQFDLKELTLEVLNTMKLQVEKQNALISFSSEGNDFIINADKLHVTSVIYNLLDNALKYSKEALVINVRLLRKQKDIALLISDNGIGIASEYQSKIFDKFFRVPTGNKHLVKGYGLGLSYVSHVMAQHHGSIQVQSEIDKGSIFTLKIPAANAES